MTDSTNGFIPRTDPVAYPESLRKEEQARLEERRRQVPPATQTTADPAIGFGLSGGGIRSATFTLGVFQALAERALLRKIDIMSTVSGGGYFGSFLGRLFTRRWIKNVADVEDVLNGIHATARAQPGENDSRAWRVFRWLRENGRYLAPRGSGDVLMLGAILLRNWVAVQVVLITTILTLFVGLQAIRDAVESALGWNHAESAVAYFLTCELAGHTHVWWNVWLIAPLVPLALLAVPTGWAYWLVVRRQDGPLGFPPAIGAVLTGVVALAGVIVYWTKPNHELRWSVSLVVAVTASIALVYWRLAEATVRTHGEDTSGDRVRSRLSRWLTNGLVATGVLLAWGIVDSLGATFYALEREQALGHWVVGVTASFAGVGAFARQLMLLLAPTKGRSRPRIPLSVVAWVAAVLVGTIWLVGIDVGSQAVAWRFQAPSAPQVLRFRPRPQVLGADRLVVGCATCGYTITAENDEALACRVPDARPGWGFELWLFAGLALMTYIFGHTRTFANLSSIHTFYAARLTRTYLGASNDDRLNKHTRVIDTELKDDCAGDVYWRWPIGGASEPVDDPTGKDIVRPYMKGGPLHIVNTTINETVTRSGVQNQDRKGTILALGPCGLSVGIRHHLVSTDGGPVVEPHGEGEFSVFRPKTRTATPDPLTLGRWTSISGAAFSAAAGSQTTVPIAILAGLFNVRLGYWWDSGTERIDRRLERLLPVQNALFSEILAQTRGTQGTLWNLSDGGHFENMGGYELIRRRLPVIVIIDAEADPDYTFDGLSDLVRKARLDFGAEITFLNHDQLIGDATVADDLFKLDLPQDVRDSIGDLDALRRGRWKGDRQPYPIRKKDRTFAIHVQRSHTSRAHAALAHVGYANGDSASWLLYVKATLMGDEPEDVCHYHRAHPDFPQETTTDQFFDEQQWESYRRLGLHIGHRVLTPALFTYFADKKAPLPKALGS